MVSYRTRTAGIYRARFTGVSERTVTDQDTGEEKALWLWTFQEVADATTAGELSKWTGTNPKSSNSNAFILLAGVMGRKPQDGDDTDTQVGKLYDVVYGPNRAGNLTVTSVVLVQEGPQAAQDAPGAAVAPEVAPAATVAPVRDPNDDLPF